jgi:hypothetical protein
MSAEEVAVAETVVEEVIIEPEEVSYLQKDATRRSNMGSKFRSRLVRWDKHGADLTSSSSLYRTLIDSVQILLLTLCRRRLKRLKLLWCVKFRFTMT